VSMAEAGGGGRPGGLPRRQVVLLASSAGLAAVLGHLLGPADRLARLGSLRELARSRLLEGADLVLLDLPDEDRAAAVGQVRDHYQGPLVVLAGEGEPPGRWGLDDACTLVARPCSVEELAAALSVPGRTAAAAAAAAVAPPPAAVAAAPGRRGPAERPRRLLVGLVEGWQTRRQVRVAGFAVLAGLAFTVAFVLAAHGRCGPGCGQLGTGLSPAPTIASIGPRAAPTSRPRHPTSTTTVVRTGAAGTGAFLGSSDRRQATATSERGAASSTREPTTTTRRPATTGPATSRPATTASTAPPTTPTTVPQPTNPPTTASG